MNKRKELIKELMKEFELKDTNDISNMFRECFIFCVNGKCQEEAEVVAAFSL